MPQASSGISRVRRRVEVIQGSEYEDDVPKEFSESPLWSFVKCGCAVMVGVFLALVVVSLQRVREPIQLTQATTVHELLARQNIAAGNSFSRSAVSSHQLRLQAAEVVPDVIPAPVAAAAPEKVAPKVEEVVAVPVEVHAEDFSDPIDKTDAPPATKVIWSTKLANGDDFQVVDEFIPADCMAQPNTDYDGPAVRWGLHPSPKVRSAAACCQLCKDWKPNPQPCNTWVFCPDPSGECWSADIWNHTTGECWLKIQKDWDENPIIANSNVQIVHKGQFSAAYRDHHKTAPLMVPWMSGTIIGIKGRT